MHRAIRRSPKRLANGFLVRFNRGSLRNLAPKLYGLGRFYAAEPRLAVRDDGAFLQGISALKNYDRLYGLTPFFVGDSDHCAFTYLSQLHHARFHFRAVHVESTRDDHV